MDKQSPFYLLNIDKNATFENFKNRITDKKVLWKSDLNVADPDGANLIEHKINQIGSSLDSEEKWTAYQKSLDATIMHYQKLGSLDIADWALEIFSNNKVEQQNDYSEIFIPNAEFPNIFLGLSKEKIQSSDTGEEERMKNIKKVIRMLKEATDSDGEIGFRANFKINWLLIKLGVNPNDEEELEEFFDQYSYLLQQDDI